MNTATNRASTTRTIRIADGQTYDGAHYVSVDPPGNVPTRSVQCPTKGAAMRLFRTLAANEPAGAQVQVYPGRIGEVDQNIPVAWTTDPS